MITPTYSPTATERVLPRLALDFTTATLDSRVTVTRALNTATVQNADGSVSIVNANLPRFDFANGVCRGLLIEETRTNLLLNSVFANAVAGTPGTPPTDWSNLVTTGTIASVTAGIYAAGNAVRITNTGTRRAFFKSYALSANTTYAYSTSVTVHSTPNVGFPRVQDCMNLSGGPVGSTVTYLLNGVAATATTVIPSGQTSRVVAIIAVSATAGNVEVRWGLGINSVVDGDVTIQMPQLEVGAFATSYIPTTTTSLTRNADNVSMTGGNFSSWYNASEGTLMLQGDTLTIANPNSTTVANLYLSSSNNIRFWIWNGQQSNLRWSVTAAGAGSADIAKAVTANTTFKAVGSYKLNKFAYALNGTATTEDVSGNVPSGLTQFFIGSIGGVNEVFSGHIAKINYYPQSLTNSEVQAFSK